MTSLLGVKIREARRAFTWPFPGGGMESWNYGGSQYFGVATSGPGGVSAYETAPAGYRELASGPFKGNAVVFAAELKRLQIFTEARFVWRGKRKGRPGLLFGTPDLGILERPWPRGTTGDLLANMMLSADIGGTAFVQRDLTTIGTARDRVRVLRPDYTTIVMGSSYGVPVNSTWQLDAEIIGFIYNPADGKTEAEPLLAEEVAMWAPIPDPEARFRGVPWMTPIIREAQADQAATMHKLMFFEQGATPQLVFTFGADINEEQFKGFVAKMDAAHAGWRNAYRTLYVGGGASPTVVGKDLQQLDFSNTQGKGETRIAAASGIHPVLIPLSEGMQGSSLNAGNYQSARDSTADTTLRPLWRGACAALQTICPPPPGAELWYDEEHIPFLREDSQKAAETERIKQETIAGYVREGFTWESAVAAVTARDPTLLEHTGLFSVQLQQLALAPSGELPPPGVGPPPGIPPGSTIPATAKPPALAAANGQGGKPA